MSLIELAAIGPLVVVTAAGSALSEEGSGEKGDRTTVRGRKELSVDTVFELLKNERRRRILEYLRDQDDETTLDRLAEHIAARENDTDEFHLSSDQRKRVYIALYQSHLPKLHDTGIIDYDQRSGSVRLLDTAHQLYPYIDLQSTSQDDAYEKSENSTMDDGERIDPSLILALGVAGLVVVGVSGIGPLTFVPMEAWSIVSVVALLFVTGRNAVRL